MKAFTFDFETLDVNDIGQWPWVFKIPVLAMVFLSTLYLGYSIFLENTGFELKEKKKTRLALQQELDMTAGLTVDEESFSHEQHKIALALEILNRQLPIETQAAKLLEEISEQALQCRLQITTVKPEPLLHKEGHIEHPITLSMIGDFHGLGEFISRLSGVEPINTIENYVLHYNKVSKTLAIQLLLKTYTAIVLDGRLETESGSSRQKGVQVEDNEETKRIEKPQILEIESIGIDHRELDSMPVPEIKKLETFNYTANSLRSPFEKSSFAYLEKPAFGNAGNINNTRIDNGNSTGNGHGNSDKQKQDLCRTKALLELYSLDSLKMVGFIERGKHIFGLIKDNAGTIHCVKPGDYIGQNEGKIEKIDANGIQIYEKLYAHSLDPEQRQITLPLYSNVGA